ncbi:hypothetical protein Q31a_53240 [Aureliella helgolandensis]|uniref:Uncharacterized protein n=1 Tax=Aureliella helgolandensis TaxID=2527968 RepID=A0A518GEB4_9BACT|nr:hypothetical protein Q31a_53240 [Aureliella helgolandensis]
MAHLMKVSGHLARTDSGHLAKCACRCCGQITFPSFSEFYNFPCNGWTGGTTTTVAGPEAAIDVCLGSGEKVLGYIEVTRRGEWSKPGESDTLCEQYDKWELRMFATGTPPAPTDCWVRYEVVESTATGTVPPSPLDPGACHFGGCVPAETVGSIVTRHATDPIEGWIFEFEFTPCE